jgi:cupin fold WbuC family metalloprotein
MKSTSVKCIDSEFIKELTSTACANSRQRQHCNFHKSHEDPCQRLVVAICPDSYIQPHRHLAYPKDELFVVLQGKIGVIIFTELGTTESVHILEAGNQVLGCEIPTGVWHTVVALEKSIFLEVKVGPYMALPDEDFASWAPAEGSEGARIYLEQLRIKLSFPTA